MPSLVLNLAGEIIDISTKSVLSIYQIMIFCRRKGDPEGVYRGSRWGPIGGSTFCTDPRLNGLFWIFVLKNYSRRIRLNEIYQFVASYIKRNYNFFSRHLGCELYSRRN